MPPDTIVQSERLRGLLVTLAMLAILAVAVMVAAWFVEQRHRGQDLQVGPFTLQVPPRWRHQVLPTDEGIRVHLLQDPHHFERQMLIALMTDPDTPTLAAALEDAVEHFAIGSNHRTQWQEQPPQTLGSSLPARWCVGYSRRGSYVHTLGVIQGPDQQYLVITLTTVGDELQHELDIQLMRTIAGSVRCEEPPQKSERRLVSTPPTNHDAPLFVPMTREHVPAGQVSHLRTKDLLRND